MENFIFCAVQKPMIRQIEWIVENGPITKHGLFLLTTSFFCKI